MLGIEIVADKTSKTPSPEHAGMTKDVVFAPVDGPLLDRIDEAYRLKYRDSRYLEPMIGTQARAATMEIRPPAGPSRR